MPLSCPKMKNEIVRACISKFASLWTFCFERFHFSLEVIVLWGSRRRFISILFLILEVMGLDIISFILRLNGKTMEF